MFITDELIREVWNKGIVDDKYPSDVVRKDACGAFILFDKYADRNSIFGWEIDHIYPVSDLEEARISPELIHDIRNLRPLNWRNNLSKGNNYPFYTAAITADDDKATNKEIETGKVVNESVQQELKELYKLGD